MASKAAVSPDMLKANDDTIRHENEPAYSLSEDEKQLEKHLVRKLDCLILPLIMMAFFLNIIDR